MDPLQSADGDREALVRLREHIAGTRPHGLIPRLRRWWELRQAEGCLDQEAAHAEGTDPVAAPRRHAAYGILTLFGVNAVRALFFSHRALTLGRVGWVLATSAGVAGLFLIALPALYRRQARSTEREYQRWLERARALPRPPEPKSIGSSR